MHGQPTDPNRVTSHQVFTELVSFGVPGIHLVQRCSDVPTEAAVAYLPTAALSAGLQRLLDVRRVIGLRNSAHSLVKLLNPSPPPSLLVSSYTHPEYLHSMGNLFRLTGSHALLLRGTEGEPVADARRIPQMDLFCNGEQQTLQQAQPGSLTQVPTLPDGLDPQATARYIQRVLQGEEAAPTSIRLQVEHIVKALA